MSGTVLYFLLPLIRPFQADELSWSYTNVIQDEDPNFTLHSSDGSPARGFGLVLYKEGTLCKHQSFNQENAAAICKSMGYDLGALKWWALSEIQEFANNFVEGLLITMSRVSCSSEDWSSCYFSNRTDFCSHNNDLILNCAKSIIEFKQCTPDYQASATEYFQADIIHWKPYIDSLDCLSWCYLYEDCRTALIGSGKCFMLRVGGMPENADNRAESGTRWQIAEKGKCQKAKSIRISPQTTGMIGGIGSMLLAMLLYFYISKRCRPYQTHDAATYNPQENSERHSASSHNSSSLTPALSSALCGTGSMELQLPVSSEKRTSDVGVQMGESQASDDANKDARSYDNMIDTGLQNYNAGGRENGGITLETSANDTTIVDTTSVDTIAVDTMVTETNAYPPKYDETVALGRTDILPCPTYDEVMSSGPSEVIGITSLTRCSF